MGIGDTLKSFLKRGKSKSHEPMDRYLNLVKKEPGNAQAHLKLAEMYQKRGDKKRAISEYLLAAEIFLKNQFYARAMAIYKQVPKQDPSLDHVYLKIADIYRKMGFLGDAFAQYRLLAQHYDSVGAKDKALEVLSLMADMDPGKTDLREKIKAHKENMNFNKETAGVNTGESATPTDSPGGEKEGFFDLGAVLESGEPSHLADFKETSTREKVYGFEEIFKELKENSGPSAVDPDFNFNLGVASREMGFLDDAIEQFRIALQKEQKPFEATSMLGLCYKERGEWDLAAESLQKALQMEGVPEEKILEVKYELGLVLKQHGRTEEALGLLREICSVNQEYRGAKEEIAALTTQKNPQGKPLA
jgi:tetratricopeptide (TPR) repeat protein